MSESRGALLYLGIFLIILVAAIMLFAFGIFDWTLIIPFVMVLSGFLVLATAALRGAKTNKYTSGSFATAGSGIFLISLGGAWYLFRYSILYSIAIVLFVLGALAIAAAIMNKK